MAIRVPAELCERDPQILAPIVGLRPDGDAVAGIVRRGKAPRFRYECFDGAVVASEDQIRIDDLAIPPAWTDVWIASHAANYLQAYGFDSARRKQYRYHERYSALSDARKFARLEHFARAVVLIRQAAATSMQYPIGTRERAVAAAVRLIDECLLRVGNERSADSGHHGATTLGVDHFTDQGGVVSLEYTAKGGQTRTVLIDDDDLADVLSDLAEEAHENLFWFQSEEGPRRATARDVNRFLVEHAGPAFSAKDFRTWGGSAIALERRAAGEPVLDAVDAAAAELGNTRTVARNAYIHPGVIDAGNAEIDEFWSSSRSSKWMSRSESALVKLLQSLEPSPALRRTRR